MKRLLCALALTLTSTWAHAFPAFELPWFNHGVQSSVYDSRDYPNAVFVLEFLSNSCSACNKNAPNVKALHASYAHNDRVQVLDVAIDARQQAVAMWTARHHPSHPVLHDRSQKLWSQIGAQTIPTVVVADCHGVVKFSHSGVWQAATIREIHSVVDQLLSEECP